MLITAKYAGQCASCGERVHEGDPCEWSPSSRSIRHPDCALRDERIGREEPEDEQPEPRVIFLDPAEAPSDEEMAGLFEE